MKVKRLEIQGFKSFKDKTVLHFDEGVTGIVGPNGCGKSNIVDSFFWVMGEQSTKHLRGQSHGDFIFNGSEKHQPSSLAEVTMVLATGAPHETELSPGTTLRDLPPHMRYQEISITRRLYRDGSTEYLINGQQCRLKDIHELFMDTGAGPKAYSIIEQGQISKIVASKPEDRRVLIEEAAGITKFKARKKESLRKIDATQQNLNRINDIIIEIERQLASLERQAQKARQYKKYKEELRDKELLVGRKKLFGLKTKNATLALQISEGEQQELIQRNLLQEAGLTIENLKIQSTEAERLVEDSMNGLQDVQRQLSVHQTKFELQKQTVQNLERSSEDLESERQELEGKIQILQVEQQKLTDDSTALKAAFENSDSVLKNHQENLDKTRCQSDALGQEIETEKRDILAGLSRQTELSNQVHSYEARVDSLSVQLNQIVSRLKIQLEEKENIEKHSKSAHENLIKILSSTQETKTRFEELRGRVQNLDIELKELRMQDVNFRETRAQVQAKHRTLEQLVANHEGFHGDIRKLLSNENFSQGISGIFADALEVHPGYEYALEAVLREFFESAFVTNQEQASQLLTFLKDQNLGRASLWAQDLIAEYAQTLQAEETQKNIAQIRHKVQEIAQKYRVNIRSLMDVMQCTRTDMAQVVTLFNRYFVVDTFSEALQLHRDLIPCGLTLVTREGDVLDSFGRISGGSIKSLEAGILPRRAELQKLTEQLVQLTQAHTELVAKSQSVETALHLDRHQLEITTGQLRELEIQGRVAENDVRNTDRQLQSLTASVAEQQEQERSILFERASLWERLDKIRIELTDLEGIARDRQNRIDEKSQEHNKMKDRVAELQGALIQFKVDFASAQEKYRFAQEKLENIKKELMQGRTQNEELMRQMNRTLDEKDVLGQELEILEKTVQNYVQQAQQVEEKIYNQKNQLERVRQQLNDVFERQRQAMRAVEEVTTVNNQNKIEQERTVLEYQNIYQGLFERYALEESAIMDDPLFADLTIEKEQELDQEVEWLKERIRKLGEVNIMAAEEFDEQKKRHEFLQIQREDLLRSIQDLEKAIQRINKTSEERFARAYEEINKRFQQIYPLVFGGGWAKLELTNPADLMETGVEIIAEPPGKKVGSIQLMSGGEKALTAVALIFSIFLMKPSPFCVLDEVDAPLDDHNVGKFNMLLKEMATRSQFIIITHNKRTMELNNKLYGVTMEDPGVSKMVSIQMN